MNSKIFRGDALAPALLQYIQKQLGHKNNELSTDLSSITTPRETFYNAHIVRVLEQRGMLRPTYILFEATCLMRGTRKFFWKRKGVFGPWLIQTPEDAFCVESVAIRLSGVSEVVRAVPPDIPTLQKLLLLIRWFFRRGVF
ncbi:MAG: hypothetical protein COV91_02860 [Candidatus Taylorbacteria bacterium CG11_big_fil_rev_8_21_14_0_20_46_11]|uniref:Uncharacterized protein n=1 Tax=Candidatus Taylorbacteria bacterium CG11_big_fil_rev_8_21_14_0_20_46_11 TaxID=1975025 RepID=A0A2H0KBP4_9BACT|nr:MAG: hypothetical protein COV91_02860 [Candidatus Taylorbacteria bacterium CG11_big_fil_rev_8_21_14_0_20_46_11]